MKAADSKEVLKIEQGHGKRSREELERAGERARNLSSAMPFNSALSSNPAVPGSGRMDAANSKEVVRSEQGHGKRGRRGQDSPYTPFNSAMPSSVSSDLVLPTGMTVRRSESMEDGREDANSKEEEEAVLWSEVLPHDLLIMILGKLPVVTQLLVRAAIVLGSGTSRYPGTIVTCADLGAGCGGDGLDGGD